MSPVSPGAAQGSGTAPVPSGGPQLAAVPVPSVPGAMGATCRAQLPPCLGRSQPGTLFLRLKAAAGQELGTSEGSGPASAGNHAGAAVWGRVTSRPSVPGKEHSAPGPSGNVTVPRGVGGATSPVPSHSLDHPRLCWRGGITLGGGRLEKQQPIYFGSPALSLQAGLVSLCPPGPGTARSSFSSAQDPAVGAVQHRCQRQAATRQHGDNHEVPAQPHRAAGALGGELAGVGDVLEGAAGGTGRAVGGRGALAGVAGGVTAGTDAGGTPDTAVEARGAVGQAGALVGVQGAATICGGRLS